MAPSPSGIFVQCGFFSCIFSFETIYFTNEMDSGYISAQAELFASGAVEIRFGQGSEIITNSFAAGVQDESQSLRAPVVLGGCSSTGVCTANQPFPSNQGLRFQCTCLSQSSHFDIYMNHLYFIYAYSTRLVGEYFFFLMCFRDE